MASTATSAPEPKAKKTKKRKAYQKEETPDVPDAVVQGVIADTIAHTEPAEPVVLEPQVEGLGEEEYRKKMQESASRISTAVGAQNPAKINELFAELNAKFNAAFPGFANIMEVTDPKTRFDVSIMVSEFLIEKGA